MSSRVRTILTTALNYAMQALFAANHECVPNCHATGSANMRASVQKCKGARKRCRVNCRRGQAMTLPSSFRCRLTIRQSLFSIRCRFGSAGASPSHFAPVPRPTTLVPLWVGAQFLRHQLRVETRSMDCLRHQLRAKTHSAGRKFWTFRTHSLIIATL